MFAWFETCRPCVSLVRFSFCWRRHNRLLMTSQLPGNCDASTWLVIYISLDIDFIHGDIHGKSCKKPQSCTELSICLSYIYSSLFHSFINLIDCCILWIISISCQLASGRIKSHSCKPPTIMSSYNVISFIIYSEIISGLRQLQYHNL